MEILHECFIRNLTDPAILVDGNGFILLINSPAESILHSAGLGLMAEVSQIDPLFWKEKPNGEEVCVRELQIGTTPRKTTVFSVGLDNGGNGFLYLFDMVAILKLMDFDVFIDQIDVAIVVTNQDGVLEHINDTVSKYIGIDAKEWVGRNLYDLVEERTLTNSASIVALKEKKPVIANVSYGTGVTIQWKSVPYCDNRRKPLKVINTGRDVTQLIQLENRLSSSENLRDQYFKRLSTLEVLLGKERIVYASEQMKHVVQLAVKASKFDSPVFLWGESGVGKEVVAQVIHRAGNRSQEPFVGVNCSAIPFELMESEFFGYEDGAFTGAKKGGRKGLFEEAEKGTIFLDEVSEITLGMQSKLLRVIQERNYMRLGSNKNVSSDVRIIAATNLSRDDIVDGAGFRKDLFYRLNVIPIYIPPLRDRRDDILPLIHFFLKELNLKHGSNIRIKQSLLPRFYHYDWPGNVRELKNFIERLLIVAGTDEVGDAEFDLINQMEIKRAADDEENVSVNRIMPLKKAIAKVEEILLRQAFRETGSIEKAAHLLEIAPSTIYRKIKRGLISLGG